VQICGDAASGGAADPSADLLDSRHQRVGEEQRPADSKAELRTRLRIGGDPARIIVGRAGNKAGPEDP
jgi:hypothetical protein